MSKQATTKNAATQSTADILAMLAKLPAEKLAELATMAAETEAPKPKSSGKKSSAPRISAGTWVTFTDETGAVRMCKTFKDGKAVCVKGSKGKPLAVKDASNVAKHANQGAALQALNAARKAATPEPAPAAPEASADKDERAERIDAHNAAIIQMAPAAKRDGIQSKLNALHKAGYRYARLARNKKHQLDGLHIYPGEKGHGRDAAFLATEAKRAANYRAKCEEIRAANAANPEAEPKPLPKRPAGVFIWSPVGGGNFYARGIFGAVKD